MRLNYCKSTAWMWSIALDALCELYRFDREGWAEDIAAARSIQKRLIDNHESFYLTSSEERVLQSCINIVEASGAAWSFQIEDMLSSWEE